MNLVIDDAVEVRQITKTNDKESRRPLGKATLSTHGKRTAANNLFTGQILLKGDNVSLIQNLSG